MDDVPDYERTRQATLRNTESSVPATRYNLRGHRSNWKEKYNRQAFHISVRRSLTLFGESTTMKVLKKELKQMIDKQVWIPVNDNYLTSEERGQVIRSSVFLKEKFRADGSFDKLKARLVASGDMQEVELSGDISSPSAITESVTIVAAIAA